MNLQEERKGVLALILLTFNFGLIASLSRYLSFYVSLYQQLYLTVGIAFILGLVIFRKDIDIPKLKRVPKKDWVIIFLRSLFGFVIGGALYRESLTLTTISNVTFLQSLPFPAILGFILFKEKFTFKKALLILLAFFGVILIAVKDFSTLFIWSKGEFFSLASAFIFALVFLSRRWLSNLLKDQQISLISLFFATIILFITSLVVDKSITIQVTNVNFLFLISLFLLGFINAIDGLLINFGFRVVKPVLASNILTLEALFAIILALIFYKEFPILKEFIGGALIIISVILMNKLEEKEKN